MVAHGNEREADQRRSNVRTALALATVAVALFLGIVIKYWFFR